MIADAAEGLEPYLDIIFIFNFFKNKNTLRNTIRVSNSLDPDQARHFVGLIWVQTVCIANKSVLAEKELNMWFKIINSTRVLICKFPFHLFISLQVTGVLNKASVYVGSDFHPGITCLKTQWVLGKLVQ